MRDEGCQGARGREGARARGREGARARGREGARARGREGARARGREGARARGREGATEHTGPWSPLVEPPGERISRRPSGFHAENAGFSRSEANGTAVGPVSPASEPVRYGRSAVGRRARASRSRARRIFGRRTG